MSEDHHIVTRARGEPLAAGSVGVRVRIQLSGYPSRRWMRDLGGCLTRELLGHPAIGHLRLNVNDIVQGNEIVLEGVEEREAPSLAGPFSARLMLLTTPAQTDRRRARTFRSRRLTILRAGSRSANSKIPEQRDPAL
jgi:hypothetical protein